MTLTVGAAARSSARKGWIALYGQGRPKGATGGTVSVWEEPASNALFDQRRRQPLSIGSEMGSAVKGDTVPVIETYAGTSFRRELLDQRHGKALSSITHDYFDVGDKELIVVIIQWHKNCLSDFKTLIAESRG